MRLILKALLATALIALAAVMCVSAQDSRPRFEVTSIKANSPSSSLVAPISITGGRFVAKDYTLTALINWAYRTSDGSTFLPGQIVGQPSWATTDHFDIQAKPEGEARSVPVEEMRAMAQEMLQDRFQLRSHRETRESSIYILTVVKQGKINLSLDQSPPPPQVGTGPSGFDPNKPPRGTAWNRVGRNAEGSPLAIMVANAVPITRLVFMLQAHVQGVVVDKTGLNGLFDFNLKFTPERGLSINGGQPGAADPPAPSLFTALQEQLGLKLESARGPVEVLVIDSVSKPTEN